MATELGSRLQELGRALDAVEPLREPIEEGVGVRACGRPVGAEGVGYSTTRDAECENGDGGGADCERQRLMGPMVRGLMG